MVEVRYILSGKKNNSKGSQVLGMDWHVRLSEVWLIICSALALFLLIALSTYNQSDPSWTHLATHDGVANGAGRVGAWLADMLFMLGGLMAYVFPILIVYGAWLHYLRVKRQEARSFQQGQFFLRLVGFFLVFVSGCGLLSLALSPDIWHASMLPGGVIGLGVASGLIEIFNILGSGLFLISFLMIGLTLFTGLSWLVLAEQCGAFMIQTMVLAKGLVKKVLSQLSLWKDKILEWRKRQASTPSKALVIAPPPVKVITEPLGVDSVQSLVPEKLSLLKRKPQKPSVQAKEINSNYQLPSIQLLDDIVKKNKRIDSKALAQFSAQVEAKLADFGVIVQVVGVYPGPVVTRYELQLAPGTKVSKITGLAKDLARSLSVISVRVVEVIPGKSYIALELPNSEREVVGLKDILASEVAIHSQATLCMALGKDISGHPVVVDLAKMPHLLVAGTTGSGKSVGLNVMLLSLLYRYTPAQLRLIMIDPKMLEFALYDGIAHLLTPVVTDMKDASCALRWCVLEMERRYRLMAALGVRNLAGLNAKIKESLDANEPLFDPLDNSTDPAKLEVLPHIVVLADEFADMMVVVGKKVETFIVRLAQKARAAGIHLILATQRPSVDVITGLIKANIPTRISFQVSSKIDSRTVLDQQGAEQLLGHGDMLYLPPGTGVPIRIHGSYVNDDEVHRVVDYLKSCSQANYLEGVLDEQAMLNEVNASGLGGDAVLGDSEQDELYDEAVFFVTKARRVSVSSVQRRFKIGYNRASRIVESMEASGVVSQMDQSGAREVLAPPPAE